MTEIINWEKALEGACNEADFLDEILRDLFEEAETAKGQIKLGYETNDYVLIGDAGHKVKGGAAQLHCYALQNVASAIQDAGRGNVASMDSVKELYVEFCECLENLREEVKNNKK